MFGSMWRRTMSGMLVSAILAAEMTGSAAGRASCRA